MAKWGEGDPRWIVEQRVDGTNVNNWHWTERDVSSWSSVLLRDLLLGVRAEGPEGVVQLTEVPKVEGESSINNRRGKLFFFYEWQLRASWLGGGVKFRGTVDVSNLSDENDMEDLDISVSLCKDQPDTPLLGLMKTRGVQEVRRALGEFVRQLKSEFSQGMILAKADGQPQLPEPQTQKNQIQTCKAQKSPTARCFSGPAPSFPGVPISTCTFNLTETFQTSPEELYRTFISQELVQVFTRCAAQVDARRGGRFQMLDGSVRGEFTQLVPNRKIEMRWRFRTWPGEHYAAVRLDLEDRGGETELRMECGGVPEGEEDSTREGWTRFYFQAIKQVFGY
ncbi:activator of 90 kDa heat shock protein ATPase homolog 1-like isoform X2 [Pseudoliparis swirei]|uniref:activator of 90 kDa heat shock protein ATPase homolog 1-like isoform X2 n=1 Tax=Pseudoliparis swirei TaxID=2059687 RepID=UPI0024BEB821|nr:activator of 90 kDa heat shock protein ATPase homolog 1-like isoform X2 [Pseudoliparis swirei]